MASARRSRSVICCRVTAQPVQGHHTSVCLQVIYLHARVDSVSTHDVLINIHPPFDSRYDPMMDHVVDEPAALEAAQDILERIANDTLDLHSAQVRIVSGQRVDQEEYLALLR